jgi:hypothetical protein
MHRKSSYLSTFRSSAGAGDIGAPSDLICAFHEAIVGKQATVQIGRRCALVLPELNSTVLVSGAVVTLATGGG